MAAWTAEVSAGDIFFSPSYDNEGRWTDYTGWSTQPAFQSCALSWKLGCCLLPDDWRMCDELLPPPGQLQNCACCGTNLKHFLVYLTTQAAKAGPPIYPSNHFLFQTVHKRHEATTIFAIILLTPISRNLWWHTAACASKGTGKFQGWLRTRFLFFPELHTVPPERI